MLASTLTTIAVFLPLAFVDGIAGQLFEDQALTVTFALIVSLLLAMTLIPMCQLQVRSMERVYKGPGLFWHHFLRRSFGVVTS